MIQQRSWSRHLDREARAEPESRAPTSLLGRARRQLDIVSQVDFEWTSEGTDELLGLGGVATPRKSPDWCFVQAREGLEPEDGNEVGAKGGATRSRRTLPEKAGVKRRHCLLTPGGLMGAMRRRLSSERMLRGKLYQQSAAGAGVKALHPQADRDRRERYACVRHSSFRTRERSESADPSC
jgi:hypothetical protein